MGSSKERKTSLAKRSLEILEIKTNQPPLEALKNLRFLIMSSVDLKILNIIQEINSLLDQCNLEEVEKKLVDLEYWYLYNKYWE